jgi:hypothetical protein
MTTEQQAMLHKQITIYNPVSHCGVGSGGCDFFFLQDNKKKLLIQNLKK